MNNINRDVFFRTSDGELYSLKECETSYRLLKCEEQETKILAVCDRVIGKMNKSYEEVLMELLEEFDIFPDTEEWEDLELQHLSEDFEDRYQEFL